MGIGASYICVKNLLDNLEYLFEKTEISYNYIERNDRNILLNIAKCDSHIGLLSEKESQENLRNKVLLRQKLDITAQKETLWEFFILSSVSLIFWKKNLYLASYFEDMILASGAVVNTPMLKKHIYLCDYGFLKKLDFVIKEAGLKIIKNLDGRYPFSTETEDGPVNYHELVLKHKRQKLYLRSGICLCRETKKLAYFISCYDKRLLFRNSTRSDEAFKIIDDLMMQNKLSRIV